MTSEQKVRLTTIFIRDTNSQGIKYVNIDDVDKEVYTDEYIEWLQEQAIKNIERVEFMKKLLDQKKLKVQSIEKKFEENLIDPIVKKIEYMNLEATTKSQIQLLNYLLNN